MKKLHGFILMCILALLCLMPEVAFAQNIRVEGTVTDEVGEELIGVSVSVKGTGTGTITDVYGNFTLTDIPAGSTLIFSYVGYITQELAVKSGRVKITLEPDSKMLEEVVVIAYGTQKKLTVTGSVSNVGSKEILKSPAASLGNAIAGKLPGVQTVQYTGLPGADDPVIRVRGQGSLNGADPLVLVDGIERPFTQIDPNEVEDITILKDASATAVFGVRGANGVILVTTKRGQVGKPSVQFSSSAGYQQVTNFIETVGSYDYAMAYNNAQKSDGVVESALKYSPEAIEHWRLGDQPILYPDMDWMNYIMKDGAWQQQYNMNVSGGTDRATYFISVGLYDQDGLFNTFNTDSESNFKYRRYNYRANIDLKLSKISKLSVGIGGRSENRNIIGDGDESLFSSLQGAVPMSGSGLDDQGRNLFSDPSLVGAYGRNGLEHFYGLGYVKESRNVLNLDLQYSLDLDFITKGLSFRAKGSYNSDYTQQKNRKTGYGASVVYTAIKDPTGVEDYVISRDRNSVNWPLPYSENKWGNRNWYVEASVNYSRSFGNHNVGGLVLYNQSKRYYPGDAYNNIYRGIPTGYVGLVGRASYDYMSRYLVDFNVGYNGSENFAPGKRYGLFPSASVGWVASSEKFWEPIEDVISFLKVRASYGMVGNDAIQNRRFLYLPAAYQYINGGPSGGGQGTTIFGLEGGNYRPGAIESAQGNSDVTWETATKQNYGIDIKLFRDKFSISADFFFEDRKDILVDNSAILPTIFGMGTSSLNKGRVKNKGYELVLRWEDRVDNFYYSISPSLTYARNKIIEMLEVKQDEPYMYKTGLPVGQPFGFEFFEFYNPGETEKRYQEVYGKPMPDQVSNVKAGDCIYVDLNGDGIIDDKDNHALGYGDVPEYNASLNLQLGYKGFDFSVLFVGATNTNRQISSYYRPQFGSMNNAALVKWVHDNSWTPENSESALLPRLTFVNAGHNTRNSRIWLVDASYIRLKNAEIGYTFKIPAIPQISNVRLYINGYNLLTFSDFKGNDPEASGTTMRYPMTRTYNFGVKVNF